MCDKEMRWLCISAEDLLKISIIIIWYNFYLQGIHFIPDI